MKSSSTRYKEKFQALREKYDQVNTKHDEYQQDLDAANKRIKRLQAENDLLLDAMNLAVPQPTQAQYIIPQQHEPHGATPPLHSNFRSNASPHVPPSYTNGIGNGVGNINGNGVPRHRSLERDGTHTEYASHETNGSLI
jgi:hypothetical protein